MEITPAIFRLHENLIVLTLAYARVAPLFFFLPFLNDHLINGQVLKNTVIVLLLFGLFPLFQTELPPFHTGRYLGALVKEATVGLILGVVLALPFWVATAIGELMDNQRGATMSGLLNPASGGEESELGAFLNFFSAVVFVLNGGMLFFLDAIVQSYQYLPLGHDVDINIAPIGSLLSGLLAKSIALAAPVLLAMFLSEVLLGLFSRFCPQLNAFSVSLSIKSIIAFSVFVVYFASSLPTELMRLISLHPFFMLLR